LQLTFRIGVDFGTTFTSVAFAHSTSPNEVKLVRTWLNARAGDETADQVPSELHYKNPITREKIWGYEIPELAKRGTPEPLKWFKLLLQDHGASTAKASEVSSSATLGSRLGALTISGSSSISSTQAINPAQVTAEKLRQLKIQPVTVVADFLTGVRNVTLASIEGTYGEKRAKKVHYVLTIPAIWSDVAKSLMIQAAEKAGFGKHRVDFELIGEPESAAAYTLKAIQPNNLSVSSLLPPSSISIYEEALSFSLINVRSDRR
jgi:molecular chaperone DnaK (HSP70)